MSWFSSIVVGLLTAAAGMILAGAIAVLSVEWYHIPGREGESGYFVALIALLLLPSRTEPVTRQTLTAAEQQWKDANIASYDMDLETTGAMTGRYHIEAAIGERIQQRYLLPPVRPD